MFSVSGLSQVISKRLFKVVFGSCAKFRVSNTFIVGCVWVVCVCVAVPSQPLGCEGLIRSWRIDVRGYYWE